jgi:hypothetical protein
MSRVVSGIVCLRKIQEAEQIHNGDAECQKADRRQPASAGPDSDAQMIQDTERFHNFPPLPTAVVKTNTISE